MIRALGTAFIAVCLTGSVVSGVEAKTHTVATGETVATIAAREHVAASRLTQINDLDGAPVLRAGTVLGLDEATVASLPAPALDPSVASAAARELRSLSTANPVEGADATMWGAESAIPASAPESAAPAATTPLHRLANRILHRTSTLALRMERDAMQFIGTPYVFGGTSPSGFDCSGFTQHVFAAIGVRLPRTADAQYYAGSRIAGPMMAGDLVFFQTYEPGPSHVGIYLGNGRFIHSSSHGVRVSALREGYWASRYLGAKRFLKAPASI